MNERIKWRVRARYALEKYFQTHSFPRAILSGILSVTGLIGFGISFGLLHGGVREMAIRYPAAVVGAYASCLGMLRLWVEFERRRFDPSRLTAEMDVPVKPLSRPRHVPGRGRSWLDWLDIDVGDLAVDGEGCVVGILIAVAVAALAVLVVAISGASTLLAEVFLDAFFVTALYRRLRVAAAEHWLGTAIRKTWSKALLLAFLLGVLGLLLQSFAPGAVSIGPALHQILHPHEYEPGPL